MSLAYSKLTSQGQISIPANVRRKLGIGPGSVVEWEEDGNKIVVRRAGRYSSEDIHQALFKTTPPRQSLKQLKEGIRSYIRQKHAPGK
jgi:antitoxin PrlF